MRTDATVNYSPTSDTISVSATSGGRIAMTIELANGDFVTSLVRLDEWYAVTDAGNDIAGYIRAHPEMFGHGGKHAAR